MAGLGLRIDRDHKCERIDDQVSHSGEDRPVARQIGAPAPADHHFGQLEQASDLSLVEREIQLGQRFGETFAGFSPILARVASPVFG